MFAEFEKIAHSTVEANAALTLDVITDTYRDLLETYFGDTLVEYLNYKLPRWGGIHGL
jgi:oligoendopeptidase F